MTYTGVLIGATAIPVWHQNVKLLPMHFAASGIGVGGGDAHADGPRRQALNDIAIGAAAVETLIGAAIEMQRTPALAPLKRGASGWVIRAGGVLSGPGAAALPRRWPLAGLAPRRERGGARRLDPHASRLDCRRPRIGEGDVMLRARRRARRADSHGIAEPRRHVDARRCAERSARAGRPRAAGGYRESSGPVIQF